MKTPMNSSEASPERVYRNPPVVEALCEVHFAPEDWVDSIPDKLYERIKEDFPRRQLREFREAHVTVSENDATATTEMRELPHWTVFLTESQDRLIQVSETILTFNQLPPYRPFSEWKDYFFNAFSICKNLAPIRKVKNIDVRYINRFEIPARKLNLEHYFTIMPTLPAECGETQGPFLIKCTIPQPDDSNFLMVTFQTIKPDETAEAAQAFVLDLHVRSLIDEQATKVDIENLVEDAHIRIATAFEGSITDKLRQVFDTGDQI